MTPEGKVKALVNKYLSTLRAPFSGVDIYVEMPVPSGYGKSGLDYTMCIWGHFVAVETKAPGEWLTPRQRTRALEILGAGGTVFVISGPEGLQAFADWVVRCRKDFAATAGK
jgi:hypothetical protein